MEVTKLKKLAYASHALSLLLAVILVILAFITWPKWIYTGIIYLSVGIVQLCFSVTLLFRLRRKVTKKEVGTIGIQHSWWILSIALASAVIFPAPFFKVSPIIITYFATSFAILWLILGSINLYTLVKETGVPLAV
jgi:cobalamin synthase